MSMGAASVRLALADTGVDPQQPELQWPTSAGTRLTGWNATAEIGGAWADSLGHGTNVAGIMAARTNDGVHFDSLGVAGVCGGDGAGNPGCRLLAIKITAGRSQFASSFDIARAILYAVSQGARAINVSFVSSFPSTAEREALRYAMSHGCLVVAAAGNNAAQDPRAPQYPAAYAADGLCLQVGASDMWDRRASFSSYGPGLDLLAPGQTIWTTSPTYDNANHVRYPGCVTNSGTSMAAPFAAGTVGLLAAARPDLCADDMRELMIRAARDIGAPGADEQTGAGVLDAAAALRAVGPGVAVWHDEVAADTWLDAGEDTLVVGEAGIGAMEGPRTWPHARRIEARATIALPDSFADSVAVWLRVAATTTVRGDFQLPYFAPRAEVLRVGPRTYTLRGWLYRVPADTPGGDDVDVPLPFDQMRFAFTVIGARAASRLAAPGAVATVALHVAPNPFRAALRIERPPGGVVAIYDVLGRRVRAWPPDASVGPIVWNGRDAAGALAQPGLYWVRARSGDHVAVARVIKLE